MIFGQNYRTRKPLFSQTFIFVRKTIHFDIKKAPEIHASGSPARACTVNAHSASVDLDEFQGSSSVFLLRKS
jgi:hypothetical protein